MFPPMELTLVAVAAYQQLRSRIRTYIARYRPTTSHRATRATRRIALPLFSYTGTHHRTGGYLQVTAA